MTNRPGRFPSRNLSAVISHLSFVISKKLVTCRDPAPALPGPQRLDSCNATFGTVEAEGARVAQLVADVALGLLDGRDQRLVHHGLLSPANESGGPPSRSNQGRQN